MIKKYFFQFSPEQRSQIIIGSILTIVVCALGGIYVFSNYLIRYEKNQFSQNQQITAWLKARGPRLIELRENISQTTPFKGKSISSVIQSALDQMHLNDFKPNLSMNSTQSVTLTFQSIPFVKIYELSVRLWEGNGLSVKNLNIKATPTEGVVQAEISFGKK